MSLELRLALITGILIYFAVIMVLLSKKRLNLKYSLLWFFSAIALLIFALFPKIIYWLSDLIGIAVPTNTVLVLVIFCMLLILISLTSIVSNQSKSIKRLIQQLAILEKQIEDVKDK